jgi:HSP90 family molecular chaperone
MARFENKFFKVLKEQDEEREAMEATLDAETDAGEFDVDVEVDETVVEDDPNVKAAIAVEERNEAMRITLQGWISQLDQFLEFLNSESPDSIQSALANAEPDTIFDRMKDSEQRKIARVASDLASLTQSFKGYIAQSANPQFKYV